MLVICRVDDITARLLAWLPPRSRPPGNNRARTIIMEPIPLSRIGIVRGSGIPPSRPRCMTISLAPPTKAGPFSRGQLLVNERGAQVVEVACINHFLGRTPVRPGLGRCRAAQTPAPAAITRRPIQVLLAWDGRIADGRIAPAIAVAQQA
jgi:hypothetical protein